MSNRFNKAVLLSGGVIAAVALASPAMAQDSGDATDQETGIQTGASAEPATDEGNRIVVTGSRIVRRDLETAAPVTVVQDEEFKLSGTVNVEQVINTLPQVIPGTTSFSNNPGNGTATLNLRGLGTNRNLVLVNGRRYMFFDTSQVVDLNTIPAFLIDSVDVVTGGASAVYGSDAIAGVINFRLRQVEGIEVGGQYSITERGDGARYEAFAALGSSFDDGRGNATVFAEYYNRKSIFQGARDFSGAVNTDGANGFVPGGSSTLPQGVLRYFGGASGLGPTARFDDPNDEDLQTDFGIGAFRPNDAVVFDVPGTFRTRRGDLYNYGPANYLQLPQERYLIGGMADYDIGGGHTAYAEVSFVNNRVSTELAATPVTGDFNVNLAAVGGFLDAASLANLQAIDAEETLRNTAAGVADDPGVVNLFIQRRVVETGSRNSLDERNAFRVLGGITGPLTDTFSYDLYYMYARTRNANVQAGNVSAAAFQRGLDGTDPAINIFGPGTLSPAAVDQISILAQNGDISALQVASAVVSGTLGNFGFLADDIGIAIGAEYRSVNSEFIPDTALSSGDVIGFNGGLPTSGQYDVKEVFAELNVPIIDRGFIHKLELTGAARYSDYDLDNVGGVWTYAAGAELAPIPDITFRGQYQRAVRAPNVAELFGGAFQNFPAATDPCSSRNTNNRTEAVRQLCIATGVPAGNVFGNIQLNDQIEQRGGGNPNLEEEVSDSYTGGVVLRPSFIPRLSATVDYYNIEVRNAISTLGGGFANTLNLCYYTIQDINSQFCQAFVGTRNAAGVFQGGAGAPFVGAANTAKLEVEGIDFQLDYGMSLPFSIFNRNEDAGLNFFFLGTYVIKNAFTPVQDLPDDIDECAGRFGQAVCGEPTPEWKSTARLSYIDGPATISFRWRHLSSVEDDNEAVEYIVEQIPSYDLFDLSFSFDITEAFTLAAGVNNLLDKTPFELGSNQEQANTYPGTYDVLGRDFFVSARMQF